MSVEEQIDLGRMDRPKLSSKLDILDQQQQEHAEEEEESVLDTDPEYTFDLPNYVVKLIKSRNDTDNHFTSTSR